MPNPKYTNRSNHYYNYIIHLLKISTIYSSSITYFNEILLFICLSIIHFMLDISLAFQIIFYDIFLTDKIQVHVSKISPFFKIISVNLFIKIQIRL